MALTRLNEFNTGTTLTEVALEGEFDNLYANALTLISPLTANLAAGGFSITGLGLGTAASPTLQLTGDTNTGIYSSGADALDLVGGGLRLATLTSTPSAGIVSINPGAISATASTNVGRLFVGGTSALTVPAGTTAIVAGLWVAEPNLTATGTITSAATCYIADAPTEATNNYALWIAGGVLRTDAQIDFASGASRLRIDSPGSTILRFSEGATPTERMRMTAGVLALGTTVVTGATAGDMTIANGRSYLSVDNAGTGQIGLIGLVAGTDQIVLATTSTTVDIRWNRALIALGGGSAATLGTIGGSGPATAGQNTWMRVMDSAGAAFWVPAWK